MNDDKEPIDPMAAIQEHLLKIMEAGNIPSETLTLISTSILMPKIIASIESKVSSEAEFKDSLEEIKNMATTIVENYIPLRIGHYNNLQFDMQAMILIIALVEHLTGVSPLVLIGKDMNIDIDKDLPTNNQSFDEMIKEITNKKRRKPW